MEKHDRLRQARIAAGFASAADAARRLNVSYGTYSGHENGSRGIKDRDLIRYARTFGVGADWLLFGTESNFSENCVIYSIGMAGHVPDGKVILHDIDRRDRALIIPPYYPPSTSFIEVSGSYLRGIADSGWIIFCDDDFKAPDDEHVGCLCLCKLSKNEIFIRTVAHRHADQTFDLDSPTFPTMRNVEILCLSPVYSIMTNIMLKHLSSDMLRVLQETEKLIGS